MKISTAFIYIAISLQLLGCRDSSSNQQNVVPVVSEPPLIDVEALKPGAHPAILNKARLVSIHELHERGFGNGEWICIEGVVNSVGDAMGVSYINLICGDCSKFVHCEGNALRKFRIPLNENVMILGRVFEQHMLGECNLVSQSQIDEALSNESRAEK